MKQKFTFYFEVFGQKKRWSTEANSAIEARGALDKFLCSQVIVHKTDGAPAEKKTGNKFQEMVGEMFGDKFSDIFK